MPEYLTSLLQRPPVGWWDLLDIAIVSILIYEFLKLIRGLAPFRWRSARC